MGLMSWWRATIAGLTRRKRVEEEMDEEIRGHIRERAEDLKRAGVPREEAQRRAKIEFGAVERFKEECREERGGMWMETLWSDARFGVRMLRKSPGFTASAILTLALGIGANTAIFSVVHAVILRPLPYQAPERLAMVKEWIPKAVPDPIPVCAPDVVQFQTQNQTFQSLAGFWGTTFDFDDGGKPTRLTVERVSASLFATLGTQPLIGRTFTAEEDRPGHLVAILSYGFWERQFGGRREVIGRSVTLNRQPYVVIGVMPRGAVFPVVGMEQGEAADVFIPMAFTPEELAGVGDNFNFSVVGRLKAGVNVEQATADLQKIARQIEETTYPVAVRSQIELNALALPLTEQVVGKVRRLLLLLLGAVGFVLLIGCINIGNLLLVRAADREREIAVRLALGASRWRLLRQLVAENLLLTLAGATLGLMLAYWTTDALLALMPKDVPLFHEVGLNLAVLGFTVGLAVVTGVAFGILPVLTGSPRDVNEALKEGGRTGTEGMEHQRLRGTLVVAEVALAMVQLVGAGLLLRSFQRVVETDPGFRPEQVLTASLSLPGSQYKEEAQIKSFYQRLMQRLRQLPGTKAAGASTDLPLEAGWTHLFTVEGYQPPPGAELNRCNHSVILGDYLQTMGVPLIRGRYFTEQDNEKSEHALIVSESLARRYWPKEDAMGKRLKWGPGDSKDPWLTIVGVVGDVKPRGLDLETTPHTYEPYLQNPGDSLNVAVRTPAEPGSMAAALRAAVWSIDPHLAVARVRTMDQVIRESTSPRRFSLLLVGSFALLALLLAGVGIYGVISYSVMRRVHEIGVRMALGAQEGDVRALVLRQSAALLGAGVAIGVAGALGVTRLLESFLYEVKPTDPLTFLSVVLALAGVALMACWVPARKATRVDPVVALRYE